MTATERLAFLMARMEPEDGVLLRDTLLRLAHLEAFMDRVAKTLDCLPSYADSRPDGGNAHIITKLNGLVDAERQLQAARDALCEAIYNLNDYGAYKGSIERWRREAGLTANAQHHAEAGRPIA